MIGTPDPQQVSRPKRANTSFVSGWRAMVSLTVTVGSITRSAIITSSFASLGESWLPRVRRDHPGVPRRIPHELRLDLADPIHLGGGGADAVGDEALHRAAARGQGVRDASDVVVDRHTVHEAECDDVEPD